MTHRIGRYISMSRLVSCLALVLLFLSAQNGFADQTVAKADRSSIRIFAKNDTSYVLGSGVIISSDGYVVTNLHVVEGASEIVIFARENGRSGYYAATVQRTLPTHDMALLRVSELRGTGATLATRLPSKGDPVFALGYPSVADAGNFDPEDTSFTESSLTRGNVSRVLQAKRADRGRPITVIQHSANLTRGNSGGGLFDACGRIIGINTLVLVDDVGQSISESVAMGSLIEVFDRTGINYRIEDAVCDPQANDVGRNSPDSTDPKPRVTGASQRPAALPALSPIEPEHTQKNYLIELALAVAFVLLGCLLFWVVSARRRNARARNSGKDRAAGRIGSYASRLGKRSQSDLLLVGTFSDGSAASIPIKMRRLKANGRLTMGREADADVTILDGSISRRHATIEMDARRMTLMDLGSTNGTWINEVPLRSNQAQSLRHGDRVRLGKVSLVLQKRH